MQADKQCTTADNRYEN